AGRRTAVAVPGQLPGQGPGSSQGQQAQQHAAAEQPTTGQLWRQWWWSWPGGGPPVQGNDRELGWDAGQGSRQGRSGSGSRDARQATRTDRDLSQEAGSVRREQVMVGSA